MRKGGQRGTGEQNKKLKIGGTKKKNSSFMRTYGSQYNHTKKNHWEKRRASKGRK